MNASTTRSIRIPESYQRAAAHGEGVLRPRRSRGRRPTACFRSARGIRPCETALDVVREFKKHLRSAFDSVVESIDGNEFTLWLRPGDRTYAVSRDYHVPYTIGYCLPHRLRHYYLARAEDALDLRQLGKTPACRDAALLRRPLSPLFMGVFLAEGAVLGRFAGGRRRARRPSPPFRAGSPTESA